MKSVTTKLRFEQEAGSLGGRGDVAGCVCVRAEGWTWGRDGGEGMRTRGAQRGTGWGPDCEVGRVSP